MYRVFFLSFWGIERQRKFVSNGSMNSAHDGLKSHGLFTKFNVYVNAPNVGIIGMLSLKIWVQIVHHFSVS